jgi:CRP/FNR family transcriptional regulator
MQTCSEQAANLCPSNPIAGNEQLFSCESFETREQFDCLGEFVDFSAGEILFSEGQTCEQVYLLSSGTVKLRIADSASRRHVIGIVSDGEILGLSAAIGDGIYEVTAEAAGLCSATAIKRQSVLNLLSTNPAACVRAAQAVIRSHRMLSSSQFRLGHSLSATGRIAGLLLDWTAMRDSKAGDKTQCMVRFTQREIAAMSATTRETVTRVLARFRREKLISVRGAALSVLNPRALEEMRGC